MAKFTTQTFSRVRSLPQPDTAGLLLVPVDVDFPSTTLAVNDIIEVVEIPAGVRLQDYSFHFPDIDSGGPTFAFSFGELNAGSTDLSTVYAAGLTAGQSNAVVRAPNVDAAQVDPIAVRRLGIKVTTAATTWAGATKTGQVVLTLRG